MTTSNVIIESNSIDNGIYSAGVYSYDDMMIIGAPSIITNNSFTANATGTLLSVSAISIITNNSFKATATTAFALTAACMVNDNIFNCTVTTFGAVSAASKINSNSFTGLASTYLAVSADCTVSNNTFLTPAASATFITLTNCSCMVNANRFVRGATSIAAYVAISGTSGHQIVDNNFDNYTINGTTETIISGIANGDTIDRNRNQIQYVSVFPNDCALGTDIGPANGTHTINPYGFVGSSDFYYSVGTLTTAVGVGLIYKAGFFVNLSRMMPKGSRVLGSLVGMRWSNIGANLNTNNCSVSSYIALTKASIPLSTPFTSPASTLAAVTSSFPTFLDAALGTVTNSYGAPTTGTIEYVAGDYTAVNGYTNPAQDLIFVYRHSFNLTTTSATSTYLLSNFLFKYVLA